LVLSWQHMRFSFKVLRTEVDWYSTHPYRNLRTEVDWCAFFCAALWGGLVFYSNTSIVPIIYPTIPAGLIRLGPSSYFTHISITTSVVSALKNYYI
jgi:hypothetical protein